MQQKFSIITVIKDDAAALEKTAKSVREQKTDLEWIIVNGSTKSDDVTRLIKKLGGIVSWSQSQPDNGLYDGLNIGLDHSTGKYVNFMNGGDQFGAPDVLPKVATVLDAKQDCDFLYGPWFRGDGNLHQPRAFANYKRMFLSNHQTMFFKRDIIGDMRYDEKYRIAADFKFCTSYLDKVSHPECVDFPIANFDPTGISSRRFMSGAKEMFAIRRERNEIPLLKNVAWTLTSMAYYKIRSLSPDFAHTCENLLQNLLLTPHDRSSVQTPAPAHR